MTTETALRRQVRAWNDLGQPTESDAAFQQVLEDLARANRELAADLNKPIKDYYDVVVIGSGPGGASLAYALRATGRSILLIERGDFLPQEPANWDTEAVLQQQRYANSEDWLDAAGQRFRPYHYYYVGGQAKLYAGTLLRFRERDFEEIAHQDGISPAWPIRYEELEPFYAEAERLYLAHGLAGEDPTEPPRSGPYPYPPIPVVHEVAELRDRLRHVGLRPFALAQGLALYSGGRCIYCAYCDCYPCRVLAKGEPELCCIRPALRSRDVTLLTRAKARRLRTDATGREVVAIEVERDGEQQEIRAGLFVVAGGAVNSPVLLLSSANDKHPNGLANSSGLVGANYMRHDITVLMAQIPEQTRLPQNRYWKSVGFSDFYYTGGPDWPYPLGMVQVIGNYHAHMPDLLPTDVGGSLEERRELAAQMLPIFVLTEDLPRRENRVSLTSDNQVQVNYRANNLDSHQRLVQLMIAKVKEAGYRLVTALPLLRVEQGGGYHHCGTLRMGDDRTQSVLDRNCRAHDLDNLYVVDASCFPSSAACNPLLTIAANALRVADHLKRRL